MIAFSAMTSVLSLYLQAAFGLTEKTIGPIFVYVGVLSLVMRSLLLGPIVDRMGERWTMRAGALLLAAGLLLYPMPQNLWTLAAVIPLVPIGTALLFPGDDVAHVALLGCARAGDHDGSGPDLRGPGPRRRAAARDDDLPAARARLAVLRRGRGVGLVGILTLRIPSESRAVAHAAEEAEAHEEVQVSADDRLDRLEQRMAVLETLVRQLAAGGVTRRRPRRAASRRRCAPRCRRHAPSAPRRPP